MADEEALQGRLRRLFLEELDEHVAVLEEGLEQLVWSAPQVPTETVAQMFRAAHSLKGAAHAVGAADLATVCHELEDTLAAIRDAAVRLDREVLDRLGAMTARLAPAGEDLRDGWAAVPAAAAAAATPPEPEQPPPAGGPVTAPPPAAPAGRETAAPPSSAGGATVRVRAETVDTLLDRAAELAEVGLRATTMAGRLVTLEDELRDADDRLREEVRLLRAAVQAAADPAPAATVLDRIEVRQRRLREQLEAMARTAARDQGEWHSRLGEFSAAARQVRTVPFRDATSGLARVLRGGAERTGKHARLVVEATDARIDKHLVAVVHDTLGHLVRNAVDHGLESPDERAAAGKDPTGTVRIEASLRSDGIAITVTDDGRGVQEERVREAARQQALALEDEGDLTPTLFRPGFTTADRLSEDSGRGVGLDAVRESVDRAGGTVTFRSDRGTGVQVGIVLPLSTSTLRAALVRVAGEVLALPSSSVQRFLELEEVSVVAGREVASLQDSVLPVVRLAHVLGWPVPQGRGDAEPRTRALMVADPAGAVLLTVEELVEEREIVVRSSPARLAGVDTVLGTAQLDDGALVLVLSPSACVRAGREQRGPRRGREPAEGAPPARTVLLVEDTLTTRELERSVLEAAGYAVLVASDGTQAWELLQERAVDAVVSDVAMPRMDGLALCRAIRSSSRLGDLPVVLVTSRSSEEDRRGGLEAGADAYLTKQGFDREELLHTLERLL